MSIGDGRRDAPRMLRYTVSELREFEQHLAEALLAGDVGALDGLYARDVTFVGPDGSLAGLEDEIEARRSGAVKFTSIDTSDLVARVYGDTGVTVSTSVISGEAGGTSFSMRLRTTRTWIGMPTGWRVVASHTSHTED
jgi:ketosteroid isomerase-like protein